MDESIKDVASPNMSPHLIIIYIFDSAYFLQYDSSYIYCLLYSLPEYKLHEDKFIFF